MIAYYECIEELRQILIADENVNKVITGLANEEDLQKQTIYPLANIIMNSSVFLGGSIQFDVMIAIMDVVDINNNSLRQELDIFKGQDNKQDVLNSCHGVIDNLERKLRKVSSRKGFEIIGSVTAEPFEDKFTDLVTGWLASFTISVPNTIQNC